MAHGQVGNVDAAAGKQRRGTDEQGVGARAQEIRKGGVDVADGAGPHDLDLQSHGAGGGLHVAQRGLGPRLIVWIDQHGHARGRGHHVAQQLEPLGGQLADEKIDPGHVAGGPGKAADETEPDRVFGDHEDDGDRRGRRLGGHRRNRAHGGDHGNLPANEVGDQGRQPVVLTLGKAVDDRRVLALDVARLLETLAETVQSVRDRVGRRVIEKSYRRHRRLGPRGDRPRRRHAADERDELAPFEPNELHRAFRQPGLRRSVSDCWFGARAVFRTGTTWTDARRAWRAGPPAH